jgi:hypothetical protein
MALVPKREAWPHELHMLLDHYNPMVNMPRTARSAGQDGRTGLTFHASFSTCILDNGHRSCSTMV